MALKPFPSAFFLASLGRVAARPHTLLNVESQTSLPAVTDTSQRKSLLNLEPPINHEEKRRKSESLVNLEPSTREEKTRKSESLLNLERRNAYGDRPGNNKGTSASPSSFVRSEEDTTADTSADTAENTEENTAENSAATTASISASTANRTPDLNVGQSADKKEELDDEEEKQDDAAKLADPEDAEDDDSRDEFVGQSQLKKELVENLKSEADQPEPSDPSAATGGKKLLQRINEGSKNVSSHIDGVLDAAADLKELGKEVHDKRLQQVVDKVTDDTDDSVRRAQYHLQSKTTRMIANKVGDHADKLESLEAEVKANSNTLSKIAGTTKKDKDAVDALNDDVTKATEKMKKTAQNMESEMETRGEKNAKRLKEEEKHTKELEKKVNNLEMMKKEVAELEKQVDLQGMVGGGGRDEEDTSRTGDDKDKSRTGDDKDENTDKEKTTNSNSKPNSDGETLVVVADNPDTSVGSVKTPESGKEKECDSECSCTGCEKGKNANIVVHANSLAKAQKVANTLLKHGVLVGDSVEDEEVSDAGKFNDKQGSQKNVSQVTVGSDGKVTNAATVSTIVEAAVRAAVRGAVGGITNTPVTKDSNPVDKVSGPIDKVSIPADKVSKNPADKVSNLNSDTEPEPTQLAPPNPPFRDFRANNVDTFTSHENDPNNPNTEDDSKEPTPETERLLRVDRLARGKKSKLEEVEDQLSSLKSKAKQIEVQEKRDLIEAKISLQQNKITEVKQLMLEVQSLEERDRYAKTIAKKMEEEVMGLKAEIDGEIAGVMVNVDGPLVDSAKRSNSSDAGSSGHTTSVKRNKFNNTVSQNQLLRTKDGSVIDVQGSVTVIPPNSKSTTVNAGVTVADPNGIINAGVAPPNGVTADATPTSDPLTSGKLASQDSEQSEMKNIIESMLGKKGTKKGQPTGDVGKGIAKIVKLADGGASSSSSPSSSSSSSSFNTPPKLSEPLSLGSPEEEEMSTRMKENLKEQEIVKKAEEEKEDQVEKLKEIQTALHEKIEEKKEQEADDGKTASSTKSTSTSSVLENLGRSQTNTGSRSPPESNTNVSANNTNDGNDANDSNPSSSGSASADTVTADPPQESESDALGAAVGGVFSAHGASAQAASAAASLLQWRQVRSTKLELPNTNGQRMKTSFVPGTRAAFSDSVDADNITLDIHDDTLVIWVGDKFGAGDQMHVLGDIDNKGTLDAAFKAGESQGSQTGAFQTSDTGVIFSAETDAALPTSYYEKSDTQNAYSGKSTVEEAFRNPLLAHGQCQKCDCRRLCGATRSEMEVKTIHQNLDDKINEGVGGKVEENLSEKTVLEIK